MIAMKVFGLALDEESQVPVLVLKDDEEEKTLPIWIGAMEAMAISLTLNNVALPRPMTHDLLLSTIRGMGGEITRIEVTDLQEGTYYAELVITIGGEEKRIDSRPSDAIALALRAEAEIFVNETVLENVDTEKAESTPVIKTEDADQWTEILEKFQGEGSKYKM
jgi:hypothetical protein